CHYSGSSNVTLAKGYLQALESRLTAMEKRLSADGPEAREVVGASIESSTPQPPRSLSGSLDILVTVHEDESPQLIDGMGSLEFVKEEQMSFFGTFLGGVNAGHSSNVPFISRVLRIVLPEREGQLLNTPPPIIAPK